jgi:hypothetical protein
VVEGMREMLGALADRLDVVFSAHPSCAASTLVAAIIYRHLEGSQTYLYWFVQLATRLRRH